MHRRQPVRSIIARMPAAARHVHDDDLHLSISHTLAAIEPSAA